MPSAGLSGAGTERTAPADVDPRARVLLGVLTPSSNTVLEPVTAALLAGLPQVSAHFGRFRVTEIALSDGALGQFDPAPILAAAELLGHAKVANIQWSGTSAGWLGFDRDEALCRRIEDHTGIPAVTAVLALNEMLQQTGVTRLGLVSPYTGDVQQRIIANYRAIGIDCPAERHLGIRDNFAFSEVSTGQLRSMIRAVAAEGVDAVVVYCTNLRGALIAAELEAETGVPVYDTVATAVRGALRRAGIATTPLIRWGRVFAEEAAGLPDGSSLRAV